MEDKIIKSLKSLGIPGIGLGIFYLLFDRFNWSFPQVPAVWTGPIVVLFLVLVFFITYKVIDVWERKELLIPVNKDNIYQTVYR